MGESGGRATQVVVVVLAALVGAAAVFVVLNPPGAGGSGLSRDTAVESSSPAGSPSGAASPIDEEPLGSEAPVPEPTAPPTSDPLTPLPDVPRTLEVDFTTQDLPRRGWSSISVGEGRTGIARADGALRHGEKVENAPAKGVVETELEAPVQRIGAEIRFAESGFSPSGFVALTISEASVVQALEAEQPLPRSGVRLVAAPGRWALVVVDPSAEAPETLLLTGEFDDANLGRSQSYDVRRQEGTVWVTDPSGATSQITDDRIADWSGAVAGWELIETRGDQTPAAFRGIWAG
ncbi:hypothetical protein [Nocardioides nanhaiensis]|uniref:Uncharacterized protein n=1 Tax=Nocardioides nanhaiensis TaxID=1476871 RepID=A0ABP8VUC0_9ACTN